MRRLTTGAILVGVLAASVPDVQALTPVQSSAAATKAKADLLTKQRAQELAKAKAEQEAKARADAVAKAKIKILTVRSVEAEIQRRVEAERKAAEANAKVTAFRAASSKSTPSTFGRAPAGHDVDGHHPEAHPRGMDHNHYEHSVSNVGHGH
jgi:hypothetical protein